jgi:large subunit ribosomal protein L17
MLRNMAVSLILNKRINTTLAKAKELRKFVEPVLTRSKADTMHNRRMVFADLQDKEAVKELFGQVAEKIATRPGGYTRIIKTGFRLGDAAEMCMMELVDFNELLLADSSSHKAKTTRRSRSSSKKVSGSAAPAPVMPSGVPASDIYGAVAVEEVAVEEISAATPLRPEAAEVVEPEIPEQDAEQITDSGITDSAAGDETEQAAAEETEQPAGEGTEQVSSEATGLTRKDLQTDDEGKGA